MCVLPGVQNNGENFNFRALKKKKTAADFTQLTIDHVVCVVASIIDDLRIDFAGSPNEVNKRNPRRLAPTFLDEQTLFSAEPRCGSLWFCCGVTQVLTEAISKNAL